MRIPQGPDELTAEWLTQALRAGGVLGAERRVNAVLAAPPPGGEGFSGQVSRLSLSYEGEEGAGPASLIAKLSASAPALRKRSGYAYGREVRFYRDLAPRVGLRTPACYYGDASRTSGLHVLLLEDLSPALPVARADGCTPDQARQGVHAIARTHGRWWEREELADFTWLEARALPNAADSAAEYEAWWKTFVAKEGDRLPVEMRGIGDAFGPHRRSIEERLWLTPPVTLKHNDFGPGNILFDPQGGPPAIIDWASMGLGRGTRDVAMFMSECPRPEVRRAIDIELLQEYHAILVEEGVLGYAFADCYEDFRYAILQRFRSIVSTIAALPFTAAQKQQVIDYSLPRNCAAILDHDAGSLLR